MILEITETKVLLNDKISDIVFGFEYDFHPTTHSGHVTLSVYEECDKELAAVYDKIVIQVRNEEGKGFDILCCEAVLTKVAGSGSVDDIIPVYQYTYTCKSVGKVTV